MSGDQPITDTKQRFVDFLYRNDGATSSEIENEFDVSGSTVRTYVHDIRSEYNVDTIKNEDGIYRVTDASVVSADENEEERDLDVTQISSRKVTKDLMDWFRVSEKKILEELKNTPKKPIEKETTEDGVDVLLSLSDIHIGEKYDPEFPEEDGERTYSKNEACRVPLKFYEQIKPKLQKLDIDTIHLCLVGDLVDGRAIYDNQIDHQVDGATMLEQLEWAVCPLWNLIKCLNLHGKLEIHSVKGNHGDIKLSGTGEDANLDLFLMSMLKKWLRGSDIERDVRINVNTSHMNKFDFRGGKYTGYINHGDDCLKHVNATTSSGDQWSKWTSKWGIDVAFRGHYHMYRVESIHSTARVIMSPSPAPGGIFADQIGSPDQDNQYKLGTLTVADDEQPYRYNELIRVPHLDYLDLEELDYVVEEVLEMEE